MSGRAITPAQLLAQVDDEVRKLLDNFSGIVALADNPSRKDKANLRRERTHAEVLAMNIARSAHSLIAMVGEAKKAVIYMDFASLNAAVAQRSALLQAQTQQTNDNLIQLKNDISSALADLDAVYYATAPRPIEAGRDGD